MATAIIPLKDLVQAKSRLAGVLRPSERRALAQAMAEDVLRVLQKHPRIERTVLVTDDPSGALLAQAYDAQCWSESELGGGGLNAVLGTSSERVRRHYPGAQLILHADLPLISQDDVTRVLDALPGGGGVVVGPDRHGRGTNLLVFADAQIPTFRFGADSYAAHVASAENISVPVVTITSTGIGLDVDEPTDLVALLQHVAADNAPATCKFLRDSDASSRLQLTLASLGAASKPDSQGENL